MKHISRSRIFTAVTPVVDGVPSQIFNYNANPVTFRTIDGALMVNATQMAKQFGKRPVDWLNLLSTKNFLTALINARGAKNVVGEANKGKRNRVRIKALKVGNLVVTNVGGRGGGGTYFHEDIAIEFARWLSPAFAVWCNDRIKELFRQSVTQQTAQEQPQPHSPEMMTIDDVLCRLREATDLVTALKQERAERERLEAILSGIKSQIDSVPSKAERLPILLPELF